MASTTTEPDVQQPEPEGRRSRRESRRERRLKRESDRASGALYPRWYWPSFAAPAIIYLAVFFVVPFYVILGVAFGTRDPVDLSPIPVWEPWWWTGIAGRKVFQRIVDFQWPVYVRTFEFVFIASALCVIIGYLVAYYVARFGGKRRGLYLALLIAPFFISYLMRMLAWINLLAPDGYMTRFMNVLPLVPHHVDWLGNSPFTLVMGLVYGYVPYMILPLYGFLDSIGKDLLEAGRDLGASPSRTFLRVMLPLSRPAILAGLVIVSLPMFGDYYTHDLLTPSPKVSMIGNALDSAVYQAGHGAEAAIYVLILVAILFVPLVYYLIATKRQMEAR
ncbi:MAG: ABC transporter permease [Actinomycetota bacterium]|nr:ABC transporter permease [Actinomycetota bacterium]